MSDYMRKIIYLRKWEGGIRTSATGYIRLERKENLLFVSLRVSGEMPEGSPVYAIYRTDEEWKCLELGDFSQRDGNWQAQIAVSALPAQECGDRISGIYMGNPAQYWAGKETGAMLSEHDLLCIPLAGGFQSAALCVTGKKRCTRKKLCCCLRGTGGNINDDR